MSVPRLIVLTRSRDSGWLTTAGRRAPAKTTAPTAAAPQRPGTRVRPGVLQLSRRGEDLRPGPVGDALGPVVRVGGRHDRDARPFGHLREGHPLHTVHPILDVYRYTHAPRIPARPA